MTEGRDDIGDETRVLVEENGERRVGAAGKVRVSSLDRGLLYGDGVFETFRCYDGEPAFLGRHASRLNGALKAVGIPKEFEVEGLKRRISEVTDAFPEDAYARITVTRGVRDGLLAPTEETPTVVVHGKPLERRRYPPAVAETATEPRPVGVLAHKKTTCYLPNVVARGGTSTEADEVLMFAEGTVASGGVSNLFSVRDGCIETPGERIREGVTREVVLEEAQRLGYGTEVGETTIEDAEAVFLTNTTWGVRPVAEVDGSAYDGTHPAVEELADAYLKRALESASG